MRTRVSSALLAAVLLVAACGEEAQEGPTRGQSEFPGAVPLEEAPPAAPPGVPQVPVPEAAPSAEEAAPAAAPPVRALERVPGPADAEVPWLPDGELVEVEHLGDPQQPTDDMSKTVFEVKALPEAALASYQQVLEKGGWKTEYMGTDTLIGYQGNTMIVASAERLSGLTRIEVFVSPRPEGLGEDAP